jgi:hypothetical protein
MKTVNLDDDVWEEIRGWAFARKMPLRAAVNRAVRAYLRAHGRREALPRAGALSPTPEEVAPSPAPIPPTSERGDPPTTPVAPRPPTPVASTPDFDLGF